MVKLYPNYSFELMVNSPDAGDTPEKEILNIEVEVECPSCNESIVTLLERILIEGSLQNYHLIHTEVNEIYECGTCKHGWSRSVYL